MQLLRPQPLGIHPGPAMNLLVSDFPGAEGMIRVLLQGETLVDVPAPLAYWQYAVAGDLASAIHSLEEELAGVAPGARGDQSSDPSGDPSEAERTLVTRYNLWVLQCAAGKQPPLESWSDPVLQELADLVAFMHGLKSELTAGEALDGELRAWALATQAAHDLEHGHDLVARQRLHLAVELCEQSSPLLAAMLLGQAAEIAQFKSELPLGLVQQELRRAIEIAQRHGLTKFEGKLWLQLGLLLQQAAGEHNRSALHESIKALQHALQLGIDERVDPLWFAEIQNSLGLAYLAMPASEASNQLRTGIAIQSFRKALETVNAVDHPQTWARISMNLANALQHAPSSHPVDNLIQAVEIYEQVLQVRTKERDPVSYALVTINQANALAHLGMFKPALEKAAEAYKLFQWYNQAEQATSARELVESINLCLTRPANHSTATAAPRGVNDAVARQDPPALEVVADGTL